MYLTIKLTASLPEGIRPCEFSTPSVYLFNHGVRPKRRGVDEEIYKATFLVSNGEGLEIEMRGQSRYKVERAKTNARSKERKLSKKRDGLEIDL
ncbi:hypothetical protein N7457_005021 [Penicillium paradoxum]|uniref:uncharacterized protein n=1 Tax=Penicillium paradoxum TaxID=176176 RepID=UPI0025470DCA|nr:uncharacterized protein N7457_005021 [Penicillium paradoxum]KAJ5783247.1 hypothetical protein N7457_005021 [Penicillium paradoxum]